MVRLLPFLLLASTAFAQYTSQPAGAPPSDLSPAVSSMLQKDGVKILNGGKVVAEFWFRTAAPRGPKTAEDNVSLQNVPQGTLLGAVRIPERFADRRGSQIKAGVYTLRYSLFPQNGDHQGVAPQRDFLLIAKAADDKDANAAPDFKTLVEWSEKALGAPHPGVFSLWKQDSGFTPGFAKQGENDWVYQFKMGDAPVAVILVGKAEG